MIFGPIPLYTPITVVKSSGLITYRTPYETKILRSYYCIAYEIPDNCYVFRDDFVGVLINDLYWIDPLIFELACNFICNTDVKKETILQLQQFAEEFYCSELKGSQDYHLHIKKYQ